MNWVSRGTSGGSIRSSGNRIRKSPGEEQVGTIGGFAGAYPEWKWNFELSYAVGGLDLNGVWRYVDSMHDANLPGLRVPHYDYFDLYASYAIENGLLGG